MIVPTPQAVVSANRFVTPSNFVLVYLYLFIGQVGASSKVTCPTESDDSQLNFPHRRLVLGFQITVQSHVLIDC